MNKPSKCSEWASYSLFHNFQTPSKCVFMIQAPSEPLQKNIYILVLNACAYWIRKSDNPTLEQWQEVYELRSKHQLGDDEASTIRAQHNFGLALVANGNKDVSKRMPATFKVFGSADDHKRSTNMRALFRRCPVHPKIGGDQKASRVSQEKQGISCTSFFNMSNFVSITGTSHNSCNFNVHVFLGWQGRHWISFHYFEAMLFARGMRHQLRCFHFEISKVYTSSDDIGMVHVHIRILFFCRG